MPRKDKGLRRERPMRNEELEGDDVLINGIPATVWRAMSDEEKRKQFEKNRRRIERIRSGK